MEDQTQRHLNKNLKWALSSVENVESRADQPQKANNCASEIDKVIDNEKDAFMHKLSNPILFWATIGDTMYLRQALAQPDRQYIIKAMLKEISDASKVETSG